MHELTKDVEERPTVAKRRISEVFAKSGYDYDEAAKMLGMHHYTLRKCARALGITRALSKARAQAMKRGELPDNSGRPRKPVPSPEHIIKAFVRSGHVLGDTAILLGVTEPTLRRWVREHGLRARLASMRSAA